MDSILLPDKQIYTFNSHFTSYKILFEKYESSPSESTQTETFEKLGFMYYLYEKYLNYYYRSIGEEIVLPKKLFERAKFDNIIDDADLWLSYIDMQNVYHQTKNNKKIASEIITFYGSKVISMYNNLNSRISEEQLAQIELIIKKINNEQTKYPNNNVIYNADELGITESSYVKILDFLSHTIQLKEFFSTVQDTIKNTHGSDLDFIFDVKVSNINKFKNDIQAIDIPYYIDTRIIGAPGDKTFIKDTINRGAKKIYDIKDFDTHWNDNSEHYNRHYNISKLVLK